LTFIQFGAEETSPPGIGLRIRCSQWSRSQDWAANAAISSLLAYVNSRGTVTRYHETTICVVNWHLHTYDKKLIRRWASERELFLRRHRTPTSDIL